MFLKSEFSDSSAQLHWASTASTAFRVLVLRWHLFDFNFISCHITFFFFFFLLKTASLFPGECVPSVKISDRCHNLALTTIICCFLTMQTIISVDKQMCCFFSFLEPCLHPLKFTKHCTRPPPLRVSPCHSQEVKGQL